MKFMLYIRERDNSHVTSKSSPIDVVHPKLKSP